jgi:hypothetical protein
VFFCTSSLGTIRQIVIDLRRSCSEVHVVFYIKCPVLTRTGMYYQSFVNVLSAKFHAIDFHRVSSCYMHVRGKKRRSQWAFWYSFDFERAGKK